MTRQQDIQRLSSDLERQLSERYGAMLGSKDLWRELGFPSPNAFRQALTRGTLDVPVFEVSNRRGRFALAKDVANWIASQRLGVVS
ncbi:MULTISPECIES: hypothetical protein [Pseudomonas fluorescens group]|jgi:hypothetical protein|uniref:hypothetical protein n=1 Tax=Pseudomonas fluorescens group TaxID=136843 RepID=UPI00123F476C|nr:MULTISPECIES: hypothetical protein [Pseudomonas fluorescens group]MDR7282907.1 hypothetical protein [Pseudomonas corrugata]